jgi:5-methylcytosine-specific restriction endonuclease McrA
MPNYVLAHVSDAVLLRDLAALAARDRATTAALLAHIAEVDARRLYVPAGYPSMHAYCVDELRLSEDAAKRRIQAARAARHFPVIFHAIAEGRLNLTGVCLIAPHLSVETARGLIESASNKRKIEIEELLARHFQLPEVRVRLITPVHPEIQQTVSARSGEGHAPEGSTPGEGALAHLPELQSVAPPATHERYVLKLIIAKTTHERLRHAQALLSHAVPTGDLTQVFDRALDALITQLEKRKLGAGTRRPRRRPAGTSATPGSRYVPAQVRRAVWERDQGQCTFVGAKGNRCKARKLLELDHVDPVARGGQATIDNMRMRCRAHNQFEAERIFGVGFMERKRQESRLALGGAHVRAAKEQSQDVFAGLRALGCRADEARRAVLLSESLRGATLEERMRDALRFLGRGVQV